MLVPNISESGFQLKISDEMNPKSLCPRVVRIQIAKCLIFLKVFVLKMNLEANTLILVSEYTNI